jgi:phage anti-repressor protein
MTYLTLDKRVVNNEEVNSIFASELHEKLEVKTPFTKWLDRKVINGLFDNTLDYVIVYTIDEVKNSKDKNVYAFLSEAELLKQENSLKSAYAKGWLKNAIITLDTAKEIAMMENNLKGKQSRRYFINVEKIAKKEIGEEKLKLELEQMKQDIKAKDNQIEYDYLKQRIDLASKLQKLGANFDPTALSKGEFKTMLPKDMGETLSNVMSDIRIGVKASSITHLISANNLSIKPKDMISSLIAIDLVEIAEFNGKKFNRFVDDFNWYGFNKNFSSRRKNPSTLLIYEDRFISLIELLKNEGYLEN